SPRPVTLTVYTGESSLFLPVRSPRAEDKELREFEEPECSQPHAITPVRPKQESWRVIRDLGRDISTLEVLQDAGTNRFEETGMEISARAVETYTYMADEYGSLSGESHWKRKFQRGDWEVHTETRTLLTSDEENFRIRADLDAWEGKSRVFSRSWDTVIPRDLV
ncbi:MAG: hypothetical protein R6V41_01225, partial [Desulfobacteraceae bacterium]